VVHPLDENAWLVLRERVVHTLDEKGLVTFIVIRDKSRLMNRPPIISR